MIKKLALLDWDGTLRSGFTIKSWIAFLVKEKLFDSSVEDSLLNLFNDYLYNKLTHDELSQSTAEIYASALKGFKERDISLAATRFLYEDKNLLNSFSLPLFSFLKKYEISIAIISGAPIEVIRAYKTMFNFDEIFALECEIEDGIYSGNIKVNAGDSKEKNKVITSIAFTNKYNFYFSMGNSSSDIPLLMASPIKAIVNNKDLVSYIQSNSQIDTKQILLLEEDTDFSII